MPKPVAHAVISRSQADNRCGGQRPCPAPSSEEHRARTGEEAATPGQPVHARALIWSVPRQFTLENHRLPLALPQSFLQARNSHVSLNPLSSSLLRVATQIVRPLVQKLWTTALPCGRPRKTKNEIRDAALDPQGMSITYTPCKDLSILTREQAFSAYPLGQKPGSFVLTCLCHPERSRFSGGAKSLP